MMGAPGDSRGRGPCPVQTLSVSTSRCPPRRRASPAPAPAASCPARPRPRRGPASIPGCSEPGKFRAPKSPEILDEFLWFCQKHVREYNAKWNFFHGTSEEDLEAQVSGGARRGAAKSLGSDQERAWNRLGFGGSKASEAGAAKGAARAYQGKRKLPPNERRAIDILDAKDFWSKADIREAYKALIKILHPDLNGGNRSHEEQLQNVVWAWAQIKDSRNFR